MAEDNKKSNVKKTQVVKKEKEEPTVNLQSQQLTDKPADKLADKSNKKSSKKSVSISQEVSQESNQEVKTKKSNKKLETGGNTSSTSSTNSSAISTAVSTGSTAKVYNEVADEVANEVTDEVVNQENHNGNFKFTSHLESVQNEIKAMRDQLHALNTNLKKLESAYNFDIKKTAKISNKRPVRTKKTGFAKAKPVPEKLAKFIGVNTGDELTGPEVTKKVWAQLKDKGLTYEGDKRVFRTDAEVSQVFDVPKSVNKSTDHKDKTGFNFCNLQKFIANAYKN